MTTRMLRASFTNSARRRMSTSTATSGTGVIPRLPRLPIPPLKDTLKRYIESLEPFLLEDAARGGQPFEEALQHRVDLAKEFEQGLGRVCQQRLIDLDNASPNNWLDDNFWLRKAYLEWRSPLLINSNWWLAFENDPGVPKHVLNYGESERLGGLGVWQIRRAAWLLHRFLDFRHRICTQELYPNTTRTGLWVQGVTPKMFGICRVPHHTCDLLTQPHPDSPFAKTVSVFIRDWVYAVNVLQDDGQPVDFEIIENRLREVATDVERHLACGESAPPVGILTSTDRDVWASNRDHLLSISDSNGRTMTAIEDSVMALCLDDYTLNENHGWPTSSSQEVQSHLHNIRSGNNGRNRWFDKALSLIVESNSRAGLMGEHSPCDALLPSIVADYALVQTIDAPEPAPLSAPSQVQTSREWQRLDWTVNDILLQKCEEAEAAAETIIAESDDNVFRFTSFGSDWLKYSGKVSPDAFVQLAMQLAWFRAKGSFTATYETVLTRLFHNGRTETIRTFSKNARSFVLAMQDAKTSTHSRRQLLASALETHGRLTKRAALGKGIDRHLLGLSLVMKESETCELFADPYFLKSQQWKLSTSGLSAGTYFRGTGFGSPYRDGYGINYLIGPEMIKFGIESKLRHQGLSSEDFYGLISSSLLEMRRTLEQGYAPAIDLAASP